MSLDFEGGVVGEIHPGVAVFVISFTVVVGIVVMNVVVAILLEGIIGSKVEIKK